jgi:hypothetical protein
VATVGTVYFLSRFSYLARIPTIIPVHRVNRLVVSSAAAAGLLLMRLEMVCYLAIWLPLRPVPHQT